MNNAFGKFGRFAVAAAVLVGALVSCGKNADVAGGEDNPGGGPDTPPAVRENCIVENGVKSEIGSTFVEFISNRLCFVVSADKVESIDALPDHTNYTVSVLPVLLGKEFNLKSETTTYSVARYNASESVGDYDIYITPGDLESTQFGYCRVVLDEQKGYAVLDLSLRQNDGTEVSVYDSLACDLRLPETSGNYIKAHGSTKPINAAFYELTNNGYVNLYFTPGAIDYYDEIESATSYVCLSVLDRKLPVGTQDVATTTAQYVVLYFNQEGEYFNSPLNIQFGTGFREGASGTFDVIHGSAEGEYSVSMNLSYNGFGIELSYSGVCRSTALKPEKPAVGNSFTFEGAEHKIKSVIVDRTAANGLVDLFFSETSRVETVDGMLAASPVVFAGFSSKAIGPDSEGEPLYCGFSQFPNFEVSYSGKSWNYANGSTGTIVVSDLGGSEYYVKFYNNAELSLEWQGKATVL